MILSMNSGVVPWRSYMGAEDWFNKISKDSKQGIIYSNESQEIIRKLSLKHTNLNTKWWSSGFRRKCTSLCANKLLKILEEPPAKTVFLLVSDQPETIITTILSRTQHIIIPALENEDIVSALTSNAEVTISPTDALNIARIAKGSYKRQRTCYRKTMNTKKTTINLYKSCVMPGKLATGKIMPLWDRWNNGQMTYHNQP